MLSSSDSSPSESLEASSSAVSEPSRSLLDCAASTEFGGDGSYVVTSTLSVGSATGRVAVGASVADGAVSLSSSARLCEAVRCVVGAFS